jgi:hypothetical protein
MKNASDFLHFCKKQRRAEIRKANFQHEFIGRKRDRLLFKSSLSLFALQNCHYRSVSDRESSFYPVAILGQTKGGQAQKQPVPH